MLVCLREAEKVQRRRARGIGSVRSVRFAAILTTQRSMTNAKMEQSGAASISPAEQQVTLNKHKEATDKT